VDAAFGFSWGCAPAVGLVLTGRDCLDLLWVDFVGASFAVPAAGLPVADFFEGRLTAAAEALKEDAVLAAAGAFAADFFLDARLTCALVDDFSSFVLLTTSPEVLAIQTSERHRDGFGQLLEPACTRQE
jgi:hypothetical protein